AEDFDQGGEGVGYHDTDAVNVPGAYRFGAVDLEPTSDTYSSYDVTSTAPGEWLNYSINAPTDRYFDITFRVASAAGDGIFHLELDGKDLTGPINVLKTASEQTFADITKTLVLVPAGDQDLRLKFDSAARGSHGNINSSTI